MKEFFKNLTLMQWVFGLGLLVNIELGIAHGGVSLVGMFPNTWIPHIIAWANGLGWLGGIIMTSLAGIGVLPKAPVPTAVKALAWFALPLALVLAMGGPVGAQAPRPRPVLTGDPVKDVKDAISQGQPGGLLPGERAVQNTPCDFNFFTAISQRNLGDQLRICANTKFAKDIQAALDSANAKQDKPAVACLEPGLEIIKAAIGTEIPPPADAPPGTLPTIEAPGLVLIFQKFREFGLANGVASCKSWINATIALTNPIGQ